MKSEVRAPNVEVQARNAEVRAPNAEMGCDAPPFDLCDRTKSFAVRVLRLVRALPHTMDAQILGNQLARSATSVAANYRAARRSRSKREFIARLGVVEEEADESCFWLELILATELLPAARLHDLLDEANQLVAIFVASRKTAKQVTSDEDS